VRRADAQGQVRGRSERDERASRVGLIRESCFHGSRDKLSQLALLSALERLCREVVVGELCTTLGVSALPEVERRIESRERRGEVG
jgi:hypothetical protein